MLYARTVGMIGNETEDMLNHPYFQYGYHFGPSYFDEEKKWFPMDTEALFDENMLNDRKRKIIQQEGWTKDNISYKLNKQSFRHDGSVPDFFNVSPGGIAYVGDSNYFGVGVNLEDVCTYKAHPKDLPYINLGCPGAGLESYYRVVRKWLPIVKPKLLMVFHTWANSRTEMMTAKGRAYSNLYSDPNDKFMRFHPLDVMTRWHLNIEAISWTCQSVGAKLWVMEDPKNKQLYPKYFNDYTGMVKSNTARDCTHAGRQWHDTMAEHLEEILHDNLS